MGEGILTPGSLDRSPVDSGPGDPGHPFHRSGGVLFCDDVPVTDAVARCATPLYLYSDRAVRFRYTALRDAFGDVDPLIAYSVKANGNLFLLRSLAELGAGADIVSGGELHRALLAGIPPDRIVFSGVGKTVEELAAALRAGIYCFNVESEGELRALSDLAVVMGKTAPIALRVNPDIETPTPHAYTRTGHAATKFGVPIDDALRLYRLAHRLPGVRIRGIDAHIGSQITAVEPYVAAVRALLDLAGRIRSHGIELEMLDIGGGLGISYEADEAISPDEFASAVVPEVRDSGMKLVLEPGRFIVGPAGVLLTRVLYVKEAGGKRFVITDAGMNDLLRPSHYSGYHHIETVESQGRDIAHVDIVGPICETGDFMALDREIELPRPGELLAIHTVGAYGFAMSSTYNQRPRPAEAVVTDGTVRLVRRRDHMDDLTAAELDVLGAGWVGGGGAAG